MHSSNFVSTLFRSVNNSESSLIDSTAYSKTVSESKEPKRKQKSSRAAESTVESTNIMNRESHIIMEETHPKEYRDDRLNDVPPQQNDSGELCPM
ncbi:hypothetical protein DPMN_052541 [Dreissena polymorpha]|uniref:Uncharacterized protein n=1 Tax=Dreissena polymorpha TaxID=45954 RepID=A0A9D4HN41_DREPO|nr:hypothetical protein DPMN_052541 [Dreissena polymorpha]